jgi:hypothetical protein
MTPGEEITEYIWAHLRILNKQVLTKLIDDKIEELIHHERNKA